MKASVRLDVQTAAGVVESHTPTAPARPSVSLAERRFALLTEHSSDVLCELRDGVVIYVSPNTARLSGHEPAWYIGRRLANLVHPDDAESFRPFVQDGYTGEIDATFRIKNAVGQWHWREARGARTRDPDGAYRSVLVLRDTHDRMIAEAALASGEARANALLQAIPDLMFRMSRDGTYLDFKAEREDELYVPAETLIGSNIRDVLPAPLSEHALALISRAIDDGGVHTLVYSLVKRAGPRDYEARITASGANEVVLICQDVTDRTRAEAALRDSEERFRRLCASSPNGIFQTDVQGRCLYTNGRWEEIAQMSADDALGEGWARAIHPDDAERVLAEWTACVESEREFAMEFRFTCNNDPETWISSRASAIRSEDGQLLGYVGTAEDISERRRAARESLAAEERAALLRERARIAQELHDSVAQFFFGIGIASKDLLDRKLPAASTVRRKLGYIQRLATDGGREVRNAVHTLSSDMPAEDFDGSMRRLIAELAASSGLTIEYERTNDGPLCAETQRELWRAAQEALYNIRKHAHASSVFVRLNVNSTEAVLSVNDDGSGVAPRIERAISNGAGFGLANLRERFASRGGKVSVEDIHPGVRVSFQLPMGTGS